MILSRMIVLVTSPTKTTVLIRPVNTNADKDESRRISVLTQFQGALLARGPLELPGSSEEEGRAPEL